MIFKKYFLFIVILISSKLFAQNIIICPSLDNIRKGQFAGWLPLYKDGEELASDADVKQFQQAVQQFVRARWDKDYLESGHCFYQGNDVVFEKIVFAHDAWRPEENKHWMWLTPNSLAECYSINVLNCPFIL